MQSVCGAVVRVVLALSVATLAVAQDAAEEAAYIRGLSQRGLHDLVVREASDFLDDHPRDEAAPLVRYQLACALYDLDRRDEAAPYFRTLVTDRAFRYAPESNFRLGQCELDADRAGPAREALLRVVADDDADYLHAAARFLLGEACMRLDDFAAAEQHYAAVVAAGGENALAARASLAWCAYRREQYSQTRERAADVLGRRPDAAVASEMHFLTGEAHLAETAYPKALSSYGKVANGSFTAATLRGAGVALAGLDRHAEAAESFARVVADHADSPYLAECARRSGVHLVLAGEPAAALKALEHRAVGDDAEASYWKGRAEAGRDRNEAALQWFERAARQSPGDELVGFLATARGDALMALGNTAEAARAYADAGSGDAQHAAAIAHLNAGDPSKALAAVTPLVENNADVTGDVFLTQGEALFALERYDEAEAAFASSLENEASQRAMSRIAWCRHLRGDDATAAKLFTRVAAEASTTPEGIDALYMAGRCYEKIGKGGEAVAPWTAYLASAPDGAHRDEVLFGLARFDERNADRHLAELVSAHPGSAFGTVGVFELAERDAAAGDLDSARTRYQLVLDADPQLAARARYGLAWVASSNDDHDEAAKQLMALLSTQGVGAELGLAACELLVWTQHERGDAKGAESAWRALAVNTSDAQLLIANAHTVASAWAASESPGAAGAFWDAVAQTRGVVDQPDARATAWLEAAWAALDAGDLPLARRRLTSAAKEHPDPGAIAEAAFFVAEALADDGDIERAMELYEAATATPGWAGRDRALYRQGFLHLEGERYAEAIAPFVELANTYSDSVLRGESLFLAGEAAFRAGNYKACVTHTSEMLDDYARHAVAPKARFRQGLALAQLDRWEDAENALTTLMRRHADFEHALEAELWRGRALAQIGQPRAARAAFQRVVSEDRGVLAARAQIGLGQLELIDGDVESALSSFLKVAVLYEDGEEVAHSLLLAGECLESLGQPDRAADRYRELIERHASSPHAATARQRLARR